MEFRLKFPDKIVFGPGTFSQLGELGSPLGDHALLVTGKSALRRSGRLDEAVDLLDRNGVAVTHLDGVENDPSLATCLRGIALVREAGCDMVVGIGGGSALDAGKAIAAMATQDGELSEYFHSAREMEMDSLPFVALPTTAGTGTECTNNAVLTDRDRAVKQSLRSESMIPSVALVDPELTLNVPPEVTARSGMDALTQAIESYVSRGANDATDALALRAIELIASGLPDAVADGSRIAHREPVALGSLLTGMAFANAGLGAVHGLAHPIGIHWGVPHGLVCAVLLPHVCQFNLSAQSEKFERIAPFVGAESAQRIPDALTALNRRVGIPADFKAYGLNESCFDRILAVCRSGSMRNNPHYASDEDLIAILRKVV